MLLEKDCSLYRKKSLHKKKSISSKIKKLEEILYKKFYVNHIKYCINHTYHTSNMISQTTFRYDNYIKIINLSCT